MRNGHRSNRRKSGHGVYCEQRGRGNGAFALADCGPGLSTGVVELDENFCVVLVDGIDQSLVTGDLLIAPDAGFSDRALAELIHCGVLSEYETETALGARFIIVDILVADKTRVIFGVGSVHR